MEKARSVLLSVMAGRHQLSVPAVGVEEVRKHADESQADDEEVRVQKLLNLVDRQEEGGDVGHEIDQ
jgi:hypothetical protein